MNARGVLLILVAFVLAFAIVPVLLSAEAQQAGKVWRIGVLGDPEGPADKHLRDAFGRQLRELGYFEGQNIAFEWRWASDTERLTGVAAELVRLKVDVIVGWGGSQAAAAAKRVTGTIPIVMISGDPVGSGLVRSLARPGGNITGLSSSSADVVGKQLELLREVVPRLSRVGILWNPDNPFHATHLGEVQATARSLWLQPQSVEARDLQDLDAAFAAMKVRRAEAFILLADGPVFLINRAVIADLATRTRLPAMYPRREHVEVGGLLAYGTDRRELFRRLAVYVDRVLKGAKPADLPVEQPTKFELVINLKTAKALGLTIPPSLLLRADQVIE